MFMNWPPPPLRYWRWNDTHALRAPDSSASLVFNHFCFIHPQIMKHFLHTHTSRRPRRREANASSHLYYYYYYYGDWLVGLLVGDVNFNRNRSTHHQLLPGVIFYLLALAESATCIAQQQLLGLKIKITLRRKSRREGGGGGEGEIVNATKERRPWCVGLLQKCVFLWGQFCGRVGVATRREVSLVGRRRGWKYSHSVEVPPRKAQWTLLQWRQWPDLLGSMFAIYDWCIHQLQNGSHSDRAIKYVPPPSLARFISYLIRNYG